jgi:hypothetical protein
MGIESHATPETNSEHRAGWEMLLLFQSPRYGEVPEKLETVDDYTITRVHDVRNWADDPDDDLKVYECLMTVEVVPEDSEDQEPRIARLRFNTSAMQPFQPTLELLEADSE